MKLYNENASYKPSQMPRTCNTYWELAKYAMIPAYAFMNPKNDDPQ
ncbi:hypothetical protein [Bartonella grahamii]|nr:hypothetical protein [Bartonella grahamii]